MYSATSHTIPVKITSYAGNYIYEKESTTESLQFFSHPEGYVEKNGSNFNYVYQYKDHLGNVRLSYADTDNNGIIDANSEIISEKNYYPFGLKHKGYNNAIIGRDHKYGYGNKEEQDELGLDWIDITARNYDPALGRWMNIDPLAEMMRRHSPYNFAFDNPIYFVDPDGMMPEKGELEETDPARNKDYANTTGAWTSGSEGCPNGCPPDPVRMTQTGDNEFSGGELPAVVINSNPAREHYNDADWASRQHVKNSFPGLFRTYERLEAKGVYPTPSKYESVGKELSSGWNRGFTAMDENAQWIMNTSAYAIGGTLATTVGGGVFLESLETGSLANSASGIYTSFVEAVEAESAVSGVNYSWFVRGGTARLHAYGSSGFAAGNGTRLTASMYWTLNGLSRTGQVTAATATTGKMLENVPVALKWAAGLIGSGSVVVSQYSQNREDKKKGK